MMKVSEINIALKISVLYFFINFYFILNIILRISEYTSSRYLQLQDVAHIEILRDSTLTEKQLKQGFHVPTRQVLI